MTFVTFEIVLFSLSAGCCLWYDNTAKDKVRRRTDKRRRKTAKKGKEGWQKSF